MSITSSVRLLEPLEMGAPTAQFRARENLTRRGERPEAIWVIEEGWAARFKLLRDGRRHISRFYAPGDLCDLSWLVAGQADQSVAALTPLRAGSIDRAELELRLRGDTVVALAVARDALAEMRSQAEWLITLGCKSAAEKIAHFLCELYFRLERRGKASGYMCEFPLSQQDIADFTGMTAVHACRSLRELRNGGVIELRRRRLRILDFSQLVRIGGFDANYLEEPRSRDASTGEAASLRPAVPLGQAAARQRGSA